MDTPKTEAELRAITDPLQNRWNGLHQDRIKLLEEVLVKVREFLPSTALALVPPIRTAERAIWAVEDQMARISEEIGAVCTPFYEEQRRRRDAREAEEQEHLRVTEATTGSVRYLTLADRRRLRPTRYTQGRQAYIELAPYLGEEAIAPLQVHAFQGEATLCGLRYRWSTFRQETRWLDDHHFCDRQEGALPDVLDRVTCRRCAQIIRRQFSPGSSSSAA